MRELVLRFVEHPTIAVAHPDDVADGVARADMVCLLCAVGELAATGEQFLLWSSYCGYWSLSRHDPRYNTDDVIEVRELTGLSDKVAA